MANPEKYTNEPSPGPAVPIRLAIVGPPKSGKTTGTYTCMYTKCLTLCKQKDNLKKVVFYSENGVVVHKVEVNTERKKIPGAASFIFSEYASTECVHTGLVVHLFFILLVGNAYSTCT